MSSMISLLWAPLDCITAWSAGGEDTVIYAVQNAIGTAIVTAYSLNQAASKPAELVTTPTTTFDKLTAQASALASTAAKKAEPAVTAATAIGQAKKIVSAAEGGNIGWESSAYDAWASQESLTVYTQCMAARTGKAGDAMIAAMP